MREINVRYKSIKLILLISILLSGCSNYPDIATSCTGSLSTAGLGVIDTKSKIGLRIERDKISLTGDWINGLNSLVVCKISSNFISKKDLIYFDTSGCDNIEPSNKENRKYGTYNILTKQLDYTEPIYSGSYVCSAQK